MVYCMLKQTMQMEAATHKFSIKNQYIYSLLQ